MSFDMKTYDDSIYDFFIALIQSQTDDFTYQDIFKMGEENGIEPNADNRKILQIVFRNLLESKIIIKRSQKFMRTPICELIGA